MGKSGGTSSPAEAAPARAPLLDNANFPPVKIAHGHAPSDNANSPPRQDRTRTRSALWSKYHLKVHQPTGAEASAGQLESRLQPASRSRGFSRPTGVEASAGQPESRLQPASRSRGFSRPAGVEASADQPESRLQPTNRSRGFSRPTGVEASADQPESRLQPASRSRGFSRVRRAFRLTPRLQPVSSAPAVRAGRIRRWRSDPGTRGRCP